MTSLVDPGAVRTLLARYTAAWRAGDRAAWLATFAEDATQEDPIGDGVRSGVEAIGGFWDDAMAGYDGGIDLRSRAVHVVGGEAAMEWTIVALDGDDEVVFDGVDVFTFTSHGSDGGDLRIATVRAFWQRDGRTRRPRAADSGP